MPRKNKANRWIQLKNNFSYIDTYKWRFIDSLAFSSSKNSLFDIKALSDLRMRFVLSMLVYNFLSLIIWKL